MKLETKILGGLCLFFISWGLMGQTVYGDLARYVDRAEKDFTWKLEEETEMGMGKVYKIDMVSQKWQGIVWRHKLLIFLPKKVAKRSTMLLLNTGGKPRTKHYFYALTMAKKIQAPMGILFNIPNQPLLGGKREDTLIAETMVRYMKTGDPNWLLLFPMVKSVVKSMDVVQKFTEKKWKQPVEKFIVTGASKRGWTSWLTASVDKRVQAIVPMVIDTLNIKSQMKYQKQCYGRPSHKLRPYMKRGLIGMLGRPEAKQVLKMVDPYSYRKKITQPKLLLNGTNDRYWVVDSLNIYWDDLVGPKWVLYVPNAGHSLAQRYTGRRYNLTRAMNGMAAFVRHQVQSKPMPKLKWNHITGNNSHCTIKVKSDPVPVKARLWVATSKTRDLRNSRWKTHPAKIVDGVVVGKMKYPGRGYVAFYAELEYQWGDLRYHLSTQMRVVGPKDHKAKPTKTVGWWW